MAIPVDLPNAVAGSAVVIATCCRIAPPADPCPVGLGLPGGPGGVS